MGETFKQNQKDKNDFPGAPFIVRMLFREKPELPEAWKMTEIMEKHCGPVEMFSCDRNMAGFAASGCMAKFKDGEMPPQLWILGAFPFSADGVDDFTKSQMWDCMDERDEILERCRWQMHASDMLALLPALERANLDMDFTDALAELFPDCEAFLFQNTGKLVRARDVRAHGLRCSGG